MVDLVFLVFFDCELGMVSLGFSQGHNVQPTTTVAKLIAVRVSQLKP